MAGDTPAPRGVDSAEVRWAVNDLHDFTEVQKGGEPVLLLPDQFDRLKRSAELVIGICEGATDIKNVQIGELEQANQGLIGTIGELSKQSGVLEERLAEAEKSKNKLQKRVDKLTQREEALRDLLEKASQGHESLAEAVREVNVFGGGDLPWFKELEETDQTFKSIKEALEAQDAEDEDEELDDEEETDPPQN